MTTEVKPITRGALELHKKLQELGSIGEIEVREWLAELDPELTPSDINFVIGHGMDGSKRWWHRNSEGFLVNGPKGGTTPPASSGDDPGQGQKGLSNELKKPKLLDPGTMSEPRDQFYTIALNLGITEKSASIATYSCWGTAEMFDPAEAWQAIVQSSALVPSQKKALWRNWCAWAGIKIPDELRDNVEKQYNQLSSTGRPGGTTVASIAPAPARRFIPIKGEVVMVEPDDPGGMAFSEALHVADRQTEKAESSIRAAAAAPAESPAMAAVVNIMGDLAKAALAPHGDPNGATSTLEIVKLMVDNVKDSSANAMTIMKQDLDHRLELEARDRKAAEERSNNILLKLTDIIDRQDRPKNPFDSLDQVLPGIGAKILNNILNPPKAERGFTITLPQGEVSLDDYERLQKIDSQKELMKTLRLNIPQFFEMARDFATATKMAAEAETERTRPAAIPESSAGKDMTLNNYCVECMRAVKVPDGIDEFTCQYCGIVQSTDGTVVPQGPGQEEDSEPEAVPTETAAADLLGDDVFIIRRSDKDREWPPESAPTPVGSGAETLEKEVVASNA